MVASEPAQTSDANVRVDDVLDHILHFAAEQSVEVLDHTDETAAEHDQGDGQED